MTNEETKLAMPSAKKVIEVIEKISRKIKLGTRIKVEKWKWKPEWLDPLMFQNRLYWFKSSDESDRFKGWIFILSEGVEEAALHVPQKDCVPILGWQRIEEILERLGYYVRVLRNVDKDSHGNHLCECAIDRNKGHIAKAVAKTRRQAVTKALLELDKELK